MSDEKPWVRVYDGWSLPDASLILAALESSGIPGELRGETLAGLAGEIPATMPMIEVYVPEDRVDEAREVMGRRRHATEGAQEPWTCAACGEPNPHGFDLCWSCAAERAPD
ncbi:MAG: DUF2007 domain-containing protein [Myxococcota bacterium]